MVGIQCLGLDYLNLSTTSNALPLNFGEADSIKEIVEKPYFSNRIGTTLTKV